MAARAAVRVRADEGPMTVPGMTCTMEKGGAGEKEERLVIDWAFAAL
jgi:hypothetical protein